MEIFIVNNPVERWECPSDPKLIKIDEIIRLDEPEVTMPQAGSPRNVSA
jgi:hypothetical protein